MDAQTFSTQPQRRIWIAATLTLAVIGLLTAPVQTAPDPKIADPGWPRLYTTRAGARVQIYQPQIASWDRQQRLVAYVAISHRANGADKAVLGTMRVEADTSVSLSDRLVRFTTASVFAFVDRHGLIDAKR